MSDAPKPYNRHPPPTTVEIENELVVRFRAEAARRGTTVPRLVRDLLVVVAADGLTRAVLDD